MSILTKHVYAFFLLCHFVISQQNISDIYSTQNLYGMRSFAMSGSNVAVLNPSDDIFINPASIKISKDRIVLNMQPYILDTYFYHLNYSQFYSKDYSFVYAISGFYSDNFELRGSDAVKTGDYSNSEMIVSFSTIRSLSGKNLQLGLTSKLINSNLHNYTSNALLFDFGLLYNLDDYFKGHKIAFVYTDLDLFKTNYHIQSESKKQYFNTAYSFGIKNLPLTFTYNNKFMINHSSTNQFGLIFDLDYIELNISYNGEIKESFEKNTEREVLNGFAFGFSVKDNYVDYSFAYKSMSDLGSHFALGLSKTLD